MQSSCHKYYSGNFCCSICCRLLHLENMEYVRFLIFCFNNKIYYFFRAGFLGVAIIYGYFLVGTVVNRFLIIPLTKWSARVERSEGDFRYKHVTVRDNAESSILYNAENFERDECNKIFHVLLRKQFYNIIWRLPADCKFHKYFYILSKHFRLATVL